MSAFLGPIHTWLYNKIKFQDELTKAILKMVADKGYGEAALLKLADSCGVLEEGELADIIDESNIHGWLQERVTVVENRLAFVVTAVLEGHPERIKDISDAVYNFGKKHEGENNLSVKEAFVHLENTLLNGMPCDRVNTIVNETEEAIVWAQNVDIHEPYWKMFKGDVQNYYVIRESLIKGMFENSGIIYRHVGDHIFELKKI